MNNKIIVLFASLIITFISCDDQIKFNSKNWKIKENQDYPFRQSMLEDIINNKIFVGENYKTIVELLGEPDNYEIKNPHIRRHRIENFNGEEIVIKYLIEIEIDTTDGIKEQTIHQLKIIFNIDSIAIKTQLDSYSNMKLIFY